MTRQTPAPRGIAPAEARYFQLMAIGPDEDGATDVRDTAVAPPQPALIGARRFGLMAIAERDEEPEAVEADLAA